MSFRKHHAFESEPVCFEKPRVRDVGRHHVERILLFSCDYWEHLENFIRGGLDLNVFYMRPPDALAGQGRIGLVKGCQ